VIGSLADAAAALAVVAPDLADGTGKGLEAEVLFGLAAKLAPVGVVTALAGSGQPLTGPFVLRGGPGHLHPPTSAASKASYFHVELSGARVELHNSLEFKGFSGVSHEMDVSAVWAEVADHVRSNELGAVPGPPELGAELKEFASDAKLAKNMVRAFFACAVDLQPTYPLAFASLATQELAMSSIIPPDVRRYWMLSTADFSGPTYAFAKHYDLGLTGLLDDVALDQALGEMSGALMFRMHLHRSPPPTPPSPPLAPLFGRRPMRRVRV
jgi:hypothetical protein